MKRGVRQQGESASSSAGIIAHLNVLLFLFKDKKRGVGAFQRIIYLCIQIVDYCSRESGNGNIKSPEILPQ